MVLVVLMVLVVFERFLHGEVVLVLVVLSCWWFWLCSWYWLCLKGFFMIIRLSGSWGSIRQRCVVVVMLATLAVVA